MEEKFRTTVDAAEIEHFSRMASDWWNPDGKFKPLHRMNPVRVEWIADIVEREAWKVEGDRHPSPSTHHVSRLHDLTLLDIGCGGGLVCEPMARLGARVTGIDASEKNIGVAKAHAQQMGLEIDYRCMTAEELVACIPSPVGGESGWGQYYSDSADTAPLLLGEGLYDIILALEIIEHVADVEAFVAASAALLKPGGIIIYSTLNRTAKSFALAIVGAEYVLRWLPRGTHDWKKFLRPSELCTPLRRHGIEVTEMAGMVMHPFNGDWRIDAKDLSVNYLVAGRKPHKQSE